MRRALAAALALSLVGGAVGVQAREPVNDTRQRLVVTAPARDGILAEMRGMLAAIDAVLRAVASDDRAAAERAARSVGMAAAVDVDPEVKRQLPQGFLMLGMQTHRAFDGLADLLKAGAPTDETLKRLSAVTANCVACHAAYRLDEAR
jgi:cytochrome c556